jgi:hypothetical protein
VQWGQTQNAEKSKVFSMKNILQAHFLRHQWLVLMFSLATIHLTDEAEAALLESN